MTRKTIRTTLAAVVLALSLLGYQYREDLSSYLDLPAPATPHSEHSVSITAQAERHILYGDESGGGHKYGVGKPCKSEFPAGWSDDYIINTITNIASNDNLTWRRESNGYYVAEDIDGDIRVRVVLGPQKQRVITGYPLNVPRNPCPANDN